MKLSLATIALSLASSAVAFPGHRRGYSGCLTQDTANTLVAEYAAIQAHASTSLGDTNATAAAIIATGYTEKSESLNSLIGLPVDTETYTSEAQYIAAVDGTAAVTLNTLEIIVGGCNYITWMWTITSIGNETVRGIHIFTVDSSGQITNTDFEFNSIAYAIDLGGTVTLPAPSRKH